MDTDILHRLRVLDVYADRRRNWHLFMLAEASYSAEEIQAFRNAGVLG
jgi:hypothetical protein